MKNIYNYIPSKGIFAMLLGLAIFTSCEKDLLQDELLSDTSVDFLYTTPEGLESAVVGLYSLNRNIYQDLSLNGTYPLILQAKSDLGVGITGEVSLYSRLLWGASLGDYGTTSGINAHWVHNYRIVDRANAVIRGAENLEDIDEDRKNQILAEAKCMRANAFFTLYRLFNNIFITTEPTTPENAFDVPQDKSSVEEIFALLRSDLDFAIEHLDYNPEQFGRWGQGAARHLRAKVALWEEDWAEAAAQADAVITSGNHSLVATEEVFAGELNHSETLFAINFERETIGGGSQHIMSWNMVSSYADAPGLIQSVENGGAGAGFISLNQYMIDLLNEDPDDKRKNNTYYIFEYAYNDETALPPGKQLGDPLDLYENSETDQNEFMLYYRRQNPGVLKFFDETVEPTDRNHYKNIMIYRLAETYLVGAEAHMMLNNTPKALEYLNKVRERANTDPVNTIDLQAILDEEARELAFEGQRWFTLKRTGKLYEFLLDHMNNDNMNESYPEGNPKVLLREYMQNWPIPQQQMDLLGPSYPQNDGYN
ncbi:RagB/SusD family nutrient uptake outer membrane protein [Flagellimonas taeanensis]|uniref:RagB/SusD family nutrient uptake outer membrane protein n=1 Tax=Flavobacteriaceae TaxID=49546 RepID=UPI000E692F1A|nr:MULTISPECIES: RagB/SusD family nutrient uptake outer membrane protein [Allomuricauda]MDC6384965.1 RagB/SusD family nutrient uptake outer membrane protein [Muricauda sp. SK9]MEE1961120.1 RagB/SusD family nutrient uptake outer membrane protein [Allomuricauda taeanensis]RIV49061.1 RagB/SusD family nutrient uptake outer membrane protein [Allomuricauda taeanensis]